MIDISNNFDIIKSSVRSADFLCQHRPLVCAVEPYRSSDRRRKGTFYWSEKMPSGEKTKLLWQNPEYRKRILETSIFKKGHVDFNPGGHKYWLGKHRSQKTKEKISKSNKITKSSPRFREHMSKILKGRFTLEKSSNWKGGRVKHSQGYIQLYQPNHPSRKNSSNLYCYEHRLVMEKYLGRYLKPEEVIHHINGIKTDNSIENLKLFANISQHLSTGFDRKKYALKYCREHREEKREYDRKYRLKKR